jgi:hypothetical protein
VCRSSHEKKSLNTQNYFSRYGKHLSGILGFRVMPEDTLEFSKRSKHLYETTQFINKAKNPQSQK